MIFFVACLMRVKREKMEGAGKTASRGPGVGVCVEDNDVSVVSVVMGSLYGYRHVLINRGASIIDEARGG